MFVYWSRPSISWSNTTFWGSSTTLDGLLINQLNRLFLSDYTIMSHTYFRDRSKCQLDYILGCFYFWARSFIETRFASAHAVYQVQTFTFDTVISDDWEIMVVNSKFFWQEDSLNNGLQYTFVLKAVAMWYDSYGIYTIYFSKKHRILKNNNFSTFLFPGLRRSRLWTTRNDSCHVLKLYNVLFKSPTKLS